MAGPSREYVALANDIIKAFTALRSENKLSGIEALSIYSPALTERGDYDFSARYNNDLPLFCGSAFKTFVLAKYLKDIDAPQPELDRRLTEPLDLDESVFSVVSPVFNPPHLTGKVQARAAIDAMIARSDNTATDMMLNKVGAENVRAFLSEQGLTTAKIPTSTRAYFSYIFGLPNYQNTNWADISKKLQDEDARSVHPIINGVEDMACSTDDFVKFYGQALGEYLLFHNRATLDRFKATLMLADAIPLVAPEGTTFFMKGGNIDVKQQNGKSQHALCIAGEMRTQWMKSFRFAMTLNWEDDTDNAGPVMGQFGMFCRAMFERLTREVHYVPR